MEEIEHLVSPNYDSQRKIYVVKLASEALGKTAEEAKERAKKLLQAYQQAERRARFRRRTFQGKAARARRLHILQTNDPVSCIGHRSERIPHRSV